MSEGVGERLVTVLLTLAVPEATDPEDSRGAGRRRRAEHRVAGSAHRVTYRRRARP